MYLYESEKVKKPDVLLIFFWLKFIFCVGVKFYPVVFWTLSWLLRVLPDDWHTIYLARYVFRNLEWWTAYLRFLLSMYFWENSAVRRSIAQVYFLTIKNQVLIQKTLKESALVFVWTQIPSAILKPRQKTYDLLLRHHFINLKPQPLFILVPLLIKRIHSVRLYQVEINFVLSHPSEQHSLTGNLACLRGLRQEVPEKVL